MCNAHWLPRRRTATPQGGHRGFRGATAHANIQLKRARDLQAAGVQTQEALDNASTAADSLKAKIDLSKQQVAASEARIGEAQQNVDNCTIRAPFAASWCRRMRKWARWCLQFRRAADLRVPGSRPSWI